MSRFSWLLTVFVAMVFFLAANTALAFDYRVFNPNTFILQSGSIELAVTDAVHIVKKGESIDKLEKMYNIPGAKIIYDNNLSNDKIGIGDRLYIFMVEKFNSFLDRKEANDVIASETPQKSGKVFSFPIEDKAVPEEEAAFEEIFQFQSNNQKFLPFLTLTDELIASKKVEELKEEKEKDIKIHTVEKGDTVWNLARANNLTVAQIAKWNDLVNANQIDVGQKLFLEAPPKRSVQEREEFRLHALNAGFEMIQNLSVENITADVKLIKRDRSLKRKNFFFVRQDLRIPLALLPVINQIVDKHGRDYVERLIRLTHKISHETGVSFELIAAKIRVESFFNQNVVSSAGAVGVMQVRPPTGQDMGCDNVYDLEQNIRAGARYLKWLYDKYEDFDLVMAAYNAGPEIVDKLGRVPRFPETQKHLARMKKYYKGKVVISS